MARLTKWRQIMTNPAVEESVLVGYCHGHAILNDGWIVTSRVKYIDRAKAQACTCNTMYDLGNELDPREHLPFEVQYVVFNLLCRNLVKRGYRLDLSMILKTLEEISRPQLTLVYPGMLWSAPKSSCDIAFLDLRHGCLRQQAYQTIFS